MHILRLSRRAASALTLLLIFMSAFSAKALHTHPDSYYAAIGTSSAASDTSSTLNDDCPICHFSFFPYMASRAEVCTVFFTFLTFSAATVTVCVHPTPIRHFALRAPPVVG